MLRHLPIFRSASVLTGAYGSMMVLCALLGLFSPCSLSERRCSAAQDGAVKVLTYGIVSLGVSGWCLAIGSLRKEGC